MLRRVGYGRPWLVRIANRSPSPKDLPVSPTGAIPFAKNSIVYTFSGMTARSSYWSLRLRLATLLGLAATYFVAGKLGLRLAFIHRSATAVWPPSGISLAALLLF